MQPYLVLRPFTGARAYVVGETIDVSDWPPRRAQLLVNQRYLTPVMAAPADVPPPASRRKEPVHA